MCALIDIYTLKEKSNLSKIKCEDLSEAAAVCLDYHDHNPGSVILEITGDLKGNYMLDWSEVTQIMKNSRNDMNYTVESGAYCIAMLVVEKVAGMKVLKQSQKRTGFDYWIGNKNDLGFQQLARLEVSGILDGTNSKIKQRVKQKVQQTQKSDNLNLNAYVVVVEFSTPKCVIIR
ncbi:MAG: hypothetical protein MI974_26680 [Chitinophagales bacterium]|nr:hypothetical protein [Chitinophagales bacterium]